MIVITGSRGFLGGNICKNFNRLKIPYKVLKHDDSDEYLKSILNKCTILIHCAGVNRDQFRESFFFGNHAFTKKICEELSKRNNKIHIIYTSSIQVTSGAGNYSESKLAAEDELVELYKNIRCRIDILRLPNIFGVGCRPYYNSVVATFIEKYLKSEELEVIEDREIELLSVNAVSVLINKLIKRKNNGNVNYHFIKTKYTIRISVLKLLILRLKYYSNNKITKSKLDKELYEYYKAVKDV